MDLATITALGQAFGWDHLADEQGVAPTLRKMIPAAVELLTMSYAEWLIRRKGIIAQLEDVPTLILMDEDLSKEGHADDEGHRALIQLRTMVDTNTLLYALLTQKVKYDEEEDTLRRKIIDDNPELRDSLVVIAKERLTKGDLFWPALKRAMLSCLFDKMKSLVKATILNAQQQAILTVEELDLPSLECLVFRPSRREGAWAPDMLYRLLTIGRDNGISRQLRENKAIWEILEQIHILGPAISGDPAEGVRATAFTFQRMEWYNEAIDINACHHPTALGDLFEFDKDTKFALIGQPCELMVRSKGYRGGKRKDENQSLTLLEIEIRERKKPELGLELLHFTNDGQTAFAMPNLLYSVPAWLLDLAVLNTDGRCRIYCSKTYNFHIEPPWKERLEHLQDRAKTVCEIAKKYADDETIVNAAARLPLGSRFGIHVYTEEKIDFLELSLKRVGRIREPFASAILAHRSAYSSRPAYPIDLTVAVDESS